MCVDVVNCNGTCTECIEEHKQFLKLIGSPGVRKWIKALKTPKRKKVAP